MLWKRFHYYRSCPYICCMEEWKILKRSHKDVTVFIKSNEFSTIIQCYINVFPILLKQSRDPIDRAYDHKITNIQYYYHGTVKYHATNFYSISFPSSSHAKSHIRSKYFNDLHSISLHFLPILASSKSF